MHPMLRMTRAELEAARLKPASVPCGSCRACCTHDRVILGPTDDIAAYRWHVEFDPAGDAWPVLDRNASGECIYLTETGCGIHGSAPDICKRMDCRLLYAITPAATRARREQESPQMIEVYAAARERLEAV